MAALRTLLQTANKMLRRHGDRSPRNMKAYINAIFFRENRTMIRKLRSIYEAYQINMRF